MTDTDPGPSRLAQQEIWRKRLALAEREYHEAAENFRQALEDNAQSDSSPAVVAAGQRKAAARAEYLRILRIFTDLVLRGKSPAKE